MTLIPRKIFEEDACMLSRELFIEEIETTIRFLASSKSLGLDGLPAKFYKKNIEWIGQELMEVYDDVFQRGTLGPKINQGVIKFLPKGGNKTLVKNWRPITLLNQPYKIIAKTLARRIAIVLGKIISVTQTGFIKGRYIF